MASLTGAEGGKCLQLKTYIIEHFQICRYIEQKKDYIVSELFGGSFFYGNKHLLHLQGMVLENNGQFDPNCQLKLKDLLKADFFVMNPIVLLQTMDSYLLY